MLHIVLGGGRRLNTMIALYEFEFEIRRTKSESTADREATAKARERPLGRRVMRQ